MFDASICSDLVSPVRMRWYSPQLVVPRTVTSLGDAEQALAETRTRPFWVSSSLLIPEIGQSGLERLNVTSHSTQELEATEMVIARLK